MFENPRGSRQAINFTANVPKILDLKSSSEQIFFRKLSLGAPEQCHTFHWDAQCSVPCLSKDAIVHHFINLVPRVSSWCLSPGIDSPWKCPYVFSVSNYPYSAGSAVALTEFVQTIRLITISQIQCQVLSYLAFIAFVLET